MSFNTLACISFEISGEAVEADCCLHGGKLKKKKALFVENTDSINKDSSHDLVTFQRLHHLIL